MTYTFYLKEANTKKESLIYFSCYFKEERKKFVYSTGEKIKPKSWDKENNRPFLKGANKDINSSTINLQLGRYAEAFMVDESDCKRMEQEFTSKYIKDCFNVRFKKSAQKSNRFFEVYKDFTTEKNLHKEWKPSTIKRYKNIKNLLEDFEKEKSYKLTFSNINESFYSQFVDFCYTNRNHYTNTLARNVGLIKTFMYWALKNNYTYNDVFINFKKPNRVVTKEEALTLDQVEELFNYECKSRSLEKVRDVFVFQCLTGLRFGELKKVNKRVVFDNCIFLKEEKDSSKEERQIPLFEITNYILSKYDYNLPLLSNQKQNEYIKAILKEAKFDYDVEFTRIKGVNQTTIVKPFYKRVSTHTARRTFVTIMRNKGVADKTIMSITGHKDQKTFNMYHKVDNNARLDAVRSVFGRIELPKIKAI
ncbi:tyrosine-type recombinase/integrase [Bizionia myxarmorum]|uniref:Site-specific integrase n=1 Tax=Bizionia myxarmorum TaxID=291186 RepID=A0A5D0R5B3_9FLAO|nr:tyrosine-type recombinase/integrase [Bizionia myxarmorum]TYB75724.1 site-specific integrase [Bizionia myxarmorum]